MAPLNCPNGVFEIVSGIVDTDSYHAEIHFPFFATGEDGLHLVEKGTPVAQVIPFRRQTTDLAGAIRSERAQERKERVAIFRNTLASDGWYRLFARAKR